MQLFGGEVKSLRDHKGKIEGAHAIVRGGEVFLIGMEIPPYQQTLETVGYDAKRVRKLLLNKKEIKELSKSEETMGLTIIPLALYNKGRVIKISIAIARGKKKGDKRETIKKREASRDIAREMKGRG
jgi:SsrA-binding protein